MSKPLIIIVLFLAAFGIGLGLRALLFPVRVPPLVNERPAEPPIFPSPVVTGQPRYILSEKQTFPLAVPVFSVSKKADTESITLMVGRLLGLTGSPSPSAGSQGIYYYWNTPSQSLTVGGDPINIAYSETKGLSEEKNITEEDLSQKAASYLTRLGIPPAPISLKKSTSVFMRPEKQDPRPVSSIGNAVLIQLSYEFTVDGFPIFVNPPTAPGVAVTVNRAGEVGSFRAFRFPDITKAGGEVGIISYDEAVKRLLSFRGVLASVETESETSETFLDKPPNISTIYKTELGYFYSPGQGVLSPVFVFYGKGTQGSLSLKTITLVSAAPDGPTVRTAP